MPPDSALLKQYTRFLEADAAGRKGWDTRDAELRKLVRNAKLGRKSQITIPISENRGVKIVDTWRSAMREGEGKLFTRAYNHRYEVKEVALENGE